MLLNIDVTIFDSWTGLSSDACESSPPPSESSEVAAPPMEDAIMLDMSKPWSSMESGYCESVSSSTLAM